MKKLQITVFFLFLITLQTYCQQTHSSQKKELGQNIDLVPKFALSGKDIVPLKSSFSKSNLTVFGFLPYWEYADAKTNLKYELLTHIALFDFMTNSKGEITNPSGWPWTDIINNAHSVGTKTILTLTNFGGAEDPAEVVHKILTEPVAQNTLKLNIKSLILTYQLDGVNVDFEGLNTADRGALLNDFMKDLTEFIHTELPGKEVSFDGPAVNWGGWDLDGLCDAVDYLIIMAYDYNGGWSSKTGAVSPLVHPSGGISVTKSLTNDYQAPLLKNPNKLILGVPYYGKYWTTSTGLANSAVIKYIRSTFYKTAADEAISKGGFIWNDDSQTPWYKWLNGEWNQVWQDNEQSLSKKYDLALQENLGGIGIWALNYDGDKPELWDLISAKFFNQLSVDHLESSALSVFPNPSNGKFFIHSSKNLAINSIAVYNPFGQKIPIELINNSFDLSAFSNGIYFVRLHDDQGSISQIKILNQ
ncbi:glycosyl hydrolase family 18 protein [Namhaeicola litoreus]|uniref:Glycosyl hydrolase family 18 protein n=1 Tax=Namhaeicola litoreus TaxID=1052145 RepID=A0ABW3Y2H0_9FLAO